MYYYKAFEVVITSDINIPFLTAYDYLECNGSVMNILRLEQFDDEFKYVVFLGMKYGGEIRSYDTEQFTIVCYEDNIRLVISKTGNEIGIICDDDHLLEALLYCFTSGIIISLYYRKYMVLHGSSFEYGGYIHAFLGDSGTGKSTLLLSMINHGAKAHTDDIIALNSHGYVPSNLDIPYKISYDSIKLLEGSSFEKQDIIDGLHKYWVKFDPVFLSKNAKKISNIFILKPNQKETVEIKPLTTIEIIKEIPANFHAFWCLPSEIKRGVVRILDSIKKQINIVSISYPKKYDYLDIVSNDILNYIENNEIDN